MNQAMFNVKRVPNLKGRAMNCYGLCSPVREEVDSSTFSYFFFYMHILDVFTPNQDTFLFPLVLLYSITNAETYRFLK